MRNALHGVFSKQPRRRASRYIVLADRLQLCGFATRLQSTRNRSPLVSLLSIDDTRRFYQRPFSYARRVRVPSQARSLPRKSFRKPHIAVYAKSFGKSTSFLQFRYAQIRNDFVIFFFREGRLPRRHNRRCTRGNACA